MPPIQAIGAFGSVTGRPHSDSQPCIRPTWLVCVAEMSKPSERMTGSELRVATRLAISTPCRWWRDMSQEKPASTELADGGACRPRPSATAPAPPRTSRATPTTSSSAVRSGLRRGTAAAVVSRASVGALAVTGAPGESGGRRRRGGAGGAGGRRAGGGGATAHAGRRVGGADRLAGLPLDHRVVLEGGVLAAGADLRVVARIQREEVGELLDPRVRRGAHLQLVVPGLDADRGVQPGVGRHHPAVLV